MISLPTTDFHMNLQIRLLKFIIRRMVLQKLISLILNHPLVGPKLVDRLSDTYFIRRAARFTAYFYLRGKQAVEDGMKHEVARSTIKSTSKFTENFKSEVRKGWEEAKRKHS